MDMSLPKKPRKTHETVVSIIIGLVILASFASLRITWSDLPQVPAQVWHYLKLMFEDPDWSRLPRALMEMWRSISMAWIGMIGTVILAIPLGMLAARGVGPAWLRALLRGLFAVIRAFPEAVVAIILLTVTGLTPFTGALALALCGIGQQSKWAYETIESLPPGPAEAVRAAGGTTAETVRWALWPQAAPALISFALYRFEINIRTSAVLGMVGAGGIGDMLSNYTNYRQWDVVGMTLIVIIVATMIVDAISGAIRRRIMRGDTVRAAAAEPGNDSEREDRRRDVLIAAEGTGGR
ncbi:phosphonate ABC transporter, permease protein PhnE [Corynebacterium aquatimens]|uniref:phosphonate ABC transporter, permease protein PhnE n=1 Tax=Corynebacterium TaxID=1716 RepID=UPI001F2FF693|nr:MULTISPECIES: phosphonate ABC transporter, permease protein PhnE [Corynebacterium]QYH20042.1 phosphonate ABC transporter, permease protein PhnE [Corynebacterium aquatimens]UIZ92753.1 phosphonate ABC transporter, permease protein PhnE [Corynebacterium sp. CNCTC7651]